MKLKSLLKLLTSLAVVAPLSLSVAACGDNTETTTKTNLDTVTSLEGVNLYVNTSANYSALDNWLTNANVFATKTLAVGYTVNWYSDAAMTTEVTNNAQVLGSVWVKITAASTDANWSGSTAAIELTVAKNDLSKITDLTFAAPVTIANNQTFNDLKTLVLGAEQFNGRAAFDGTETLTWYADATTTTIIDGTANTTATTYYVVIAAGVNDPQWMGISVRLEVTIQKASLNDLTELTFASPIAYTTGQTYANLDAQITGAEQFSNNALMGTPKVEWYKSETSTSPMDSTSAVTAGTVFVKITADTTDTYWMGYTNMLQVNVKQSLSNVTTLTLNSITHDNTKNYSELNPTILAASELTGISTADATLTYYSDAAMTTNVTEQTQAAGSVWVVITAGATDSNWSGSTGAIEISLT